MKNLKQILSVMMTMVLVVTMANFMPDQAIAANNPIILVPNIGRQDILYGSTDSKTYQVTIDKDGYSYLEFTMNGLDKNIKDGWNIQILDKDYNIISEDNHVVKNLKGKTLNFQKDSIVYIKVTASGSDSFAPSFVNYQIKFTTVTDSTWEKETGNTAGEATTLKNDTICNGNLYLETDADYYKYIVEKNGYTTFSFEYSISDIEQIKQGWKVSVFDQNLSLISTYNFNSKAETKKLNFKKGTVLYIKVEAYSANSYGCPVDVTYTLTAKNSESKAWELEKNNTWASATMLKNSVMKYGNFYMDQDKDMYYFIAPSTGRYSVTFASSVASTEAGSGWNLSFYNAGKKLLRMETGLTSKRTFTIPVKRGARIYIKLEGATTWSTSELVGITYSMKVRKR
ncbi:MAG: hypothetical protein RSI06_03230 [Lachnospiraceae bacterium]